MGHIIQRDGEAALLFSPETIWSIFVLEITQYVLKYFSGQTIVDLNFKRKKAL